MSFADFANSVGMSKMMRKAFAADLRFQLGEVFNFRTQGDWDRLYAQTGLPSNSNIPQPANLPPCVMMTPSAWSGGTVSLAVIV